MRLSFKSAARRFWRPGGGGGQRGALRCVPCCTACDRLHRHGGPFRPGFHGLSHHHDSYTSTHVPTAINLSTSAGEYGARSRWHAAARGLPKQVRKPGSAPGFSGYACTMPSSPAPPPCHVLLCLQSSHRFLRPCDLAAIGAVCDSAKHSCRPRGDFCQHASWHLLPCPWSRQPFPACGAHPVPIGALLPYLGGLTSRWVRMCLSR